MKSHKTQIYYSDWIRKELHSYKQQFSLETENDFLKNSVFMVTVTFDQSKIHALRTQTGITGCDLEMNAGSFLYRSACHILDLRKGKTGRAQRPFMASAVDYNGSKACSFQAPLSNNLHLHSLWAAHPEDVVAYIAILTSGQMKTLTAKHAVKAVHVERFDPSKALSNAVDYVFKAWHKSQFQPNGLLGFEITRGGPTDPLPAFKFRTQSPAKALAAPLKRYRRHIATYSSELLPWEIAA